jgi:hypothetical protein
MKHREDAESANLFVDLNCQHSRIKWGALQHVYLDDGRAIIWQEGTCKDCNTKMQLDYTACPPRLFLATTK